uniref:Integrase catalytic domain-containing protein n=2 Tax=Nicotiana TaxID=4085 RepID=A0A1S4BBU7_TOBAC|nr:PREDICTED: uncharacterized protein LOC104235061 [Nicotiana sylvestris]XP_016486293.1 PREDICTED: uncharacterized protein LOC107806618 [Nicotiana tabacum]
MADIVPLLSNSTISSWVVDSGATHHITYNKEVLNNVKTSGKEGSNGLQLPTGNKAGITHTLILRGLYIKDGLYSGKVLQIAKESEGLYILRECAKFDVNIKILRNDNGTKFFNSKCNELLYSFGIIHQSSCSYTYQQNGTVERKHRHIMELSENAQFPEPLSTPTYSEQNTPASPAIAPEPHPNSPEPHEPSTTDTNTTSAEEDSIPDNEEIPGPLLPQQVDTASSSPSQPPSPPAFYLKSFSVVIEPKTYKEVAADQNWVHVMEQKIKALEDNHSWEIVNLPADKQVIGSKWVYKVKHKANSEIDMYKARLVAKGYTQQEGLDYHETPIAKM